MTRLPEPPRHLAAAFAVAVLFVALAGTIGAFLSVQSGLPASMAIHYGTDGRANGFASPVVFLEIGVVTELGVGSAMVALVWAVASIPWLRGRGQGRLMAGLALLMVSPLMAMTALWSVSFWQAAGAWPAALPGATLLGLLGLALPMLSGLILALEAYPRATLPLEATMLEASAGSGVRFRCPACGSTTSASAWALLGPRVGGSTGVAGGSFYYRRCPRCGERGWQRLLR